SYILQAGNCWTPQVKDFVMQDVTQLAQEMPEITKTIMNLTTDLGQVVNNATGAGLTIHRVNVNKNVPFEEALKHAQNILKTKRKFKEKIVGNNYHFRVLAKTKFKKGTWKSKKINKNVTLVMAELK
ncbi:MAG: hypothetical protein P4L31_05635, partial [Candidatus Babeliales bacterium]|nr:hypothetical protein [Candidatus Babeliales bacterium]